MPVGADMRGMDLSGIERLCCHTQIDEYYISVIPTILGSGMRLFGEISHEIKLRLVRTQVCNRITELAYACKEKTGGTI